MDSIHTEPPWPHVVHNDRAVERYRQLETGAQQCWTKRASMSGQQEASSGNSVTAEPMGFPRRRAGSDERLGFTAAQGAA